MTLAWAQVLMLPLDVSNNRSFGGGIDMQLFWFIIYIATACLILFIIPVLTAFYEADPEWSCVIIKSNHYFSGINSSTHFVAFLHS